MPPSNTRVKKMSVYMSTPLYAIMACKGASGLLGLEEEKEEEEAAVAMTT